MSDHEHKVIRGFGERLAIDQELRALAETQNAVELELRARSLAENAPLAANALLRQLDTDDAQLRGGLGLVAQQLPPELIIPMLEQAAIDPGRSEQARLTAVMILERYLDQVLDPSLTQALPNAADVARQSATEALDMSEESPLVLVEYASQLLDEPDDVVAAVLDVITHMDDPRRARLLMTLAAYGGPQMVAQVGKTLGGMRQPEALEALLVLAHLAEPDGKPGLTRLCRKLQLTGIRTPSATPLRMLWSPVNAQGQSLLWIVHPGQQGDTADLLSLVLHDTLGILHADAALQVDLSSLPLPAPPGHIHTVRIPGSQHRARLLEIQQDFGQLLLNDAIESLSAADLIWPGEIVVFGHWIWPELWRPDDAAWPELPPPAAEATASNFESLLNHTTFASWVWDLPQFADIFEENLNQDILTQDSPACQIVAGTLVEGENTLLLAQRLYLQASWLTISGDTENAALVLAARDGVQASDPTHPFIRFLAWRSLLAAAAEHAAEGTLRMRE